MRFLAPLRLHYDEVAGRSKPRKKAGSVFASVAYSHRKQLNQKVVIPERIKEIFKKPSDEDSPEKMALLCTLVRREIEREEEVFLTSEKDIEDLALAVERCDSTRYGDKVGLGSEKVPCGARVQIVTRDSEASVEDMRAQTVEWLRAVHINEAVSVKMRPMGTCREPPLSPWTKKTLMKRRKADVYKTYQFVSKGKTVQEMRDLLFVALWEALFLTSCENWSEQGVANTSRADAYELGWWFKT